MIPAPWDVPDFESEDPSAPGRPLPTLVSLHFLRSALKRRWVACVLSAVLGLLVAAAFLVAFPPEHKAEAVLVLAHDQQVDSTRAMSTDVSLLTTRTVAAQTVASLGLTMTSDDFLGTVTAVPVSADVMSLTLTAPTDVEAVRRLQALTSTYLAFRAEQLALQSNVVVEGMNQRIAELQAEAVELTERVNDLAAAGESGETDLSEALAERRKVTGRIETLEQSVQDATLRNESIMSSSRVIDAAAVEAGGMKRRIALILASGLIAGAALGCGTVLFLAITSDRLRRRFDVGAALEVTVPVSVRRIAPLPRPLQRLMHLRAIDARRADERRRLAHAIEMELPGPGQWGRLAVACIDNSDEVRFAVATAAMGLAADERGVVLTDLTAQGGLDAAVEELMSGQSVERPTVLRPRGIPALADHPADLQAVGRDAEEDTPPSPDLADVSLVLADLDPSVAADHLKAWTERVIVVVTSGLSSVERVRTAGDLVRSAGLDLRFAALLHADATDVSSGLAGSVDASTRKRSGR
jgi:capsular polysaccharide biosynthesis protein